MRTQLILTTAAIGVASTLGAIGQVYSVNAVGYINLKVPAKSLVLAANQLKAGGNKLSEVFPAPAAGTEIFKYTQAGGFSLGYLYDEGWNDPNATVNPGEGFFIRNNSNAEITLTLVGEVPQGDLKTTLAKGYNLVSSQVPQGGLLVTDLKFPAAEGDIVYAWNTAAQTYKEGTISDSEAVGGWDNGQPNIAVGEGFFVVKAAAGSWDRVFSVN